VANSTSGEGSDQEIDIGKKREKKDLVKTFSKICKQQETILEKTQQTARQTPK